ncbi:hypothetical protein D3C86_1467360 [compost metagenome]
MWGGQCGICGKDFVVAELDVDHVVGNHSLKEFSDIQSFIEAIVLVQESDLQFACKGCHKIKNMSERSGLSFAEASIEKICIDLVKKGLDVEWLKAHNITPASSAAKRRAQIREILMEELENGSGTKDS